jgi:peptide/nickel transport system ATP-binding protein
MNEPMLRLRDIHKTVEQRGRPVYVLRGIDFHVDPGEIVALVGESGSGKSTLARIIMQLYTPERGEIDFDGGNVTRARGRLLRQYRSAVQMVFQDPYASLNPTHAVRTILKRSLPPHLRRASRREKAEIFARVLEQVGLTPPGTFLGLYPHQLSGGQRQRVAFARVLEFQPRLVVADESVSMLDVSLRLGILNLMLGLNERFGIAYLYITHDLASARLLPRASPSCMPGRSWKRARPWRPSSIPSTRTRGSWSARPRTLSGPGTLAQRRPSSRGSPPT